MPTGMLTESDIAGDQCRIDRWKLGGPEIFLAEHIAARLTELER